MLSTMFEMSTNWIGYYKSSSMMRAFDYRVQFTDLDRVKTDKNGHSISCAVLELANCSLDEPGRVYHLASLIEQKFPNINWDRDEQLFNFEQQVREFEFQNLYFEKTGKSHSRQFDSDHAWMFWYQELHIFLEQCKSDILLRKKVVQERAKW